jgi:hypothetical protein
MFGIQMPMVRASFQQAQVIQHPIFKVLLHIMFKQRRHRAARRTFLSQGASKTLQPLFQVFTPFRLGEQREVTMETLALMAVTQQEQLH